MLLQSQKSAFNGVQKLKDIFGFDVTPDIYKHSKICAQCKLFLEKLEANEKTKKKITDNLNSVVQKTESNVKRCSQVSPIKGVSDRYGHKKKTRLAFESPQKENRPSQLRMEVSAKNVQTRYHPITPKPALKDQTQVVRVPPDQVQITVNENNNISVLNVPLSSQLGKISNNWGKNKI